MAASSRGSAADLGSYHEPHGFCGVCRRLGLRYEALHKVGEQMSVGDSLPCLFCSAASRAEHNEWIDTLREELHGYFPPVRHELTQDLCCDHFAMVMGSLAAEWCGVEV